MSNEEKCELQHRLGHLDRYRLGDDESAIARAMATPPMLQQRCEFPDLVGNVTWCGVRD